MASTSRQARDQHEHREAFWGGIPRPGFVTFAPRWGALSAKMSVPHQGWATLSSGVERSQADLVALSPGVARNQLDWVALSPGVVCGQPKRVTLSRLLASGNRHLCNTQARRRHVHCGLKLSDQAKHMASVVARRPGRCTSDDCPRENTCDSVGC